MPIFNKNDDRVLGNLTIAIQRWRESILDVATNCM